jgi:hypothetical protein
MGGASEMYWIRPVYPTPPHRAWNTLFEIVVTLRIIMCELINKLMILFGIRRSSVQRRYRILWSIEKDETNTGILAKFSDAFQRADVRCQCATAERAFGCWRDAGQLTAGQSAGAAGSTCVVEKACWIGFRTNAAASIRKPGICPPFCFPQASCMLRWRCKCRTTFAQSLATTYRRGKSV